jgi:leader peptidase (prepilin peptidase) / N-methyltransferase
VIPPPFPVWALAGVFGLLIGSFLNVVIYRLPRHESVIFWRSRCPACKHEIRLFDNVPLLSWLVLLGRCRDCRAPISVRYPLVEAATGVLFALVVARLGVDLLTPFRLFFAAAMVVVVFIDFEHQLIPDRITLPGLVLGLAASFLGPPGPASAAMGALVGGGALYAVGLAYEKVRGIEGMGGGDVKLGLMLGAFTGWQGALFSLMAASAAGAVVGLALVAAKRAGGRTALPFGAFLAPAGVLALFVAPAVFSWYGAFLRR